jgi:peroxiredoxin Q/BCP
MHPRPAPDFCLLDQTGTERSLKDYQGRWLVVYFYPNDRSLGCTKEACNFRDEYRIISQFGDAEVIGINKASVESHRKFVQRNHLNFPVLSDPKHKVTSAYGAWRSNKAVLTDKAFGTRRNSYLINPDGMIVKEYIRVNPNDHASEVINDLQAFQIKKSKATKNAKI